jgi:hypothetical protein
MATRKRQRLPDPNANAVRLVEAVTGSEPVKGEDLIGDEDLRRKFIEAKKRAAGGERRSN